METRPIRPHTLIAPLLIGIISLLGICAIMALSFLPKQDAEIIPTQTPTSFKYLFLGTETLIATSDSETSESRVAATETFAITNPETEATPFFLATEPNETSPAGFSTSTSVATVTFDPIFDYYEPLTVGIYDDIDYGFNYIGIWYLEDNIDAYQESVFVSDNVGDYVAFSFLGYQMALGYQSSNDAGQITINIDGSEWTITQQEGILWNSDEFEPGTHYVIITHTGEGPINVDYIEIPE